MSNYKIDTYFIDDIKRNKKFDLYVIVSDDILKIEKYKELIFGKSNKNIKEKNKNKLMIITQNKQIEHIIKCVNITKNMYYLYSSDEYLTNKFKLVYESNLAKYNHSYRSSSK